MAVRRVGHRRSAAFRACGEKACSLSRRHAPVAQLDRALPSEGKGQRFESCRVRHTLMVLLMSVAYPWVISIREALLPPVARTASTNAWLNPAWTVQFSCVGVAKLTVISFVPANSR